MFELLVLTFLKEQEINQIRIQEANIDPVQLYQTKTIINKILIRSKVKVLTSDNCNKLHKNLIKIIN